MSKEHRPLPLTRNCLIERHTLVNTIEVLMNCCNRQQTDKNGQSQC